MLAEAVDCESDCDMAIEEGGLRSGGAAAILEAGPPFACEVIGGYGGEVGVRGWMGVFVWLLALATTSKGGEAGEKRPVESSRWRLAVCSDMKTALAGDDAWWQEPRGAQRACRDGRRRW